jgi:hypothetical protein
MDLRQNTLQVVEIKEVRPKILWCQKKAREARRKQKQSKARAQKTEAMRSAIAKEVASFWANSVRVLLADMQSRFSMIQVDLDATQNFVIDDKLIAQLNDRPAFHIERFLL